ncbi:hypothetical protein [Thermococcus pacificus]|uniref:hypothetical protein n=1 Tax=Thermococcus pacificus TaxID=71998 RepID=UPI0018E000E3|nr:hypothetical protein [Thermococcus pacificus]
MTPNGPCNLHVLMMAFGTRSKEEVAKLEKELKEVEDWMNSSYWPEGSLDGKK